MPCHTLTHTQLNHIKHEFNLISIFVIFHLQVGEVGMAQDRSNAAACLKWNDQKCLGLSFILLLITQVFYLNYKHAINNNNDNNCNGNMNKIIR